MITDSVNIWAGFITYGAATAPYLEAFLASLIGQDVPLHIIAFDNTPEETNANRTILSHYPSIAVLGTGENIGFSRAYNIMMRQAATAGADYFLVINPDTVLEPDAVGKLVDVLSHDATLGSVAPKLRRWDFAQRRKTTQLDSCGLRLVPGLEFHDIGQGEEDRGQHDSTAIIGPSGAAGLYRVAALEAAAEAGRYFDEHFFMYKEDCDLAYRLEQAGFPSRLVPAALVYHDRSDTGGSLRDRFANRFSRTRNNRRWAFINQHLLFLKYWRRQGFFGKWAILFRAALRFAAALLLEPYLLKEYGAIAVQAKDLKKY